MFWYGFSYEMALVPYQSGAFHKFNRWRNLSECRR